MYKWGQSQQATTTQSPHSTSFSHEPNNDTVIVRKSQPYMLGKITTVMTFDNGECLKNADHHVGSFHQSILLCSIMSV